MENETGVDRLDMPNLDSKSSSGMAESLVKVAMQQLSASSKYKEPLLEKWKMYEDLKAGRIKKKLRIPFQVALPVFSGMLDTLAADFDEPVELEYYNTKPADYFKAKKVQGAWNTEKNKTDKNSRWDWVSRNDKSLAIMHGRGIIEYFADSAGKKYKSNINVVDPLYFHCQPEGGGLLENHLFAGKEDVFLTESQLNDGDYDKAQVKKLIDRTNSPDFMAKVQEQYGLKMQRFAALGLNPEKANYVGEKVFNFCQWVLTYKGKKWYLLFDPATATWVRACPLVDLKSDDTFPWKSWATHEDSKVFWSMSYADILYPVADSIITLFNQELTNREKRNLGARAYDKDMFPDVAKLDAAQYRPDALVPADTKGGTKQISQGIYRFDTAELQGTINLLDWIQASTGKDTGITDIDQGANQQKGKKVGVAYIEQNSVAKRLSYKSQSYSECWGEIGKAYAIGLKDHMTQDMAIQLLGDMGFEWDELTRDDLDLEGDLGVRVISSTARKEEAQQKKNGRIEAMKMLIEKKTQNVNSEMMDEAILRDVGGYDDDEIKLFMDTRNYASKDSVAKAHIAIQMVLNGKEPEFNFSADAVYLKIIRDYAFDNRAKLGMTMFQKLMDIFASHAKTGLDNTVRGAKQRGRTAGMLAQPTKDGGAPNANPTATPSPEVIQAGATMQ